MIGLTVIIAAATVGNVVVYYLESESTAKQVNQLTTTARGIVDAMNMALSDSRTAIGNAFQANKAAVDILLR